ncbi:uncharacterized protein LOC129235874 [Anastrepha obliqua]|uniref:uncharacterized protein LOC129235874 n=1 Tax=Anastrepha obliqua TaxID=95512 RepID=UPI00240A5280|nr:uncharacterized protein LOC129235874 [Anastrepha obliqua]
MLKVLQINLHKSKNASAELLLNIEGVGYDVALVQEPWIASGNIVSGLKSQNYNTYIPIVKNKVRTAILVKKSICSYIDHNLSSDDLTVVALEGCKDETLLFGSCYMPHDEEAPQAELRKLVETAARKKHALVVGTDANAHHTVWGSADINDREWCAFTSPPSINLHLEASLSDIKSTNSCGGTGSSWAKYIDAKRNSMSTASQLTVVKSSLLYFGIKKTLSLDLASTHVLLLPAQLAA